MRHAGRLGLTRLDDFLTMTLGVSLAAECPIGLPGTAACPELNWGTSGPSARHTWQCGIPAAADRHASCQLLPVVSARTVLLEPGARPRETQVASNAGGGRATSRSQLCLQRVTPAALTGRPLTVRLPSKPPADRSMPHRHCAWPELAEVTPVLRDLVQWVDAAEAHKLFHRAVRAERILRQVRVIEVGHIRDAKHVLDAPRRALRNRQLGLPKVFGEDARRLVPRIVVHDVIGRRRVEVIPMPGERCRK
jgi:hypothetical protein